MDLKTIRSFRENLRKFERTVEEMNSENCCCGVSVPQCHALMELEDLNDTTINDLSDRLSLDKSTVSRTVESLVRSELVTRETPAENRRITMISLTAKGRAVCDQINSLNDGYVENILNQVPEKDLRIFLRSFNVILECMASPAGKKCTP